MNKRPEESMTDEECDLIEEKADAIGELLSDTPSIIVLHALMRIAADVGVQNKDNLTKREFVADCVECLDFWYDTWEREEANE
jgi:hypothetical protein